MGNQLTCRSKQESSNFFRPGPKHSHVFLLSSCSSKMLSRIKQNLKIASLSRSLTEYEDGSDTNIQTSDEFPSHKYPEDFMNLPEELIVKILLLYTARKPSEYLCFLRQTCLICKRWKGIIYNNPLFWDTIYIGSLFVSNPEQLVNRTCTWIEHSGSVPMIVELDLAGWRSSGPLPAILEIIREILPRLQVLILRGWRTYLNISKWFNSQSGVIKTRALQKLYIAASSTDGIMSSRSAARCEDLRNLISGSPNLISFATSGMTAPNISEILQYKLHYRQLTQLKLDCPVAPEQALAILDDCSALTEYVHFTLDNSKILHGIYTLPLLPKPHAQNHRVVCLAKTISLATVSTLDYCFFLRLITPMLQHLEIDFINTPYPFQLSSAINYLLEDNWRARIQKLTLGNFPNESVDLLNTLQHLSPTLHSLALCSTRPSETSKKFDEIENFSSQVMQALTYRTNTSVNDALCPHLKTLVLDKVTKCTSRAIDGQLSAMIQSRWQTPLPEKPDGVIRQDQEIEQWFLQAGLTRLRSVDVVFYASRSGTKKDAKRLREMFNRGLEGGIKYGEETAAIASDTGIWWS
ncbi:hypothetical protein BJ165DRAFT_1505545 [Panaeolus papilionaceus]|nr:hypothetical protein BJ165DRAFT_1505545 [Panaeolus papilionaceus]